MSEVQKLPTEDDIAKLPRWAKVAFAARCARRVQPLFQRCWPEALAEHLQAIDRALELVEKSAAHSVNRYVRAAAAAYARADAAIYTRANATVCGGAATRAASAATRAATAAARAAARADDARAAAAAFAAAARAAVAGIWANARVGSMIWDDFITILALSKQQQWTDKTPVPPSVFGAMSSNGVPQDLSIQPTDKTEPNQAEPDLPLIKGLIFELYATLETPPDVIEEGLVRIYKVANNYHMARGAGVLSFSKFRRMVNACVLEPVGG